MAESSRAPLDEPESVSADTVVTPSTASGAVVRSQAAVTSLPESGVAAQPTIDFDPATDVILRTPFITYPY